MNVSKICCAISLLFIMTVTGCSRQIFPIVAPEPYTLLQVYSQEKPYAFPLSYFHNKVYTFNTDIVYDTDDTYMPPVPYDSSSYRIRLLDHSTSTNNNSDEAEEYYLIGSIHDDYDSLQFVLYNYYFNNVNSQRCNNKLLVFINKEYYGYYYIGNGEIRFFIKDNELWCAINNTTTCLITIFQNKLNLSDLFIYYNRGDFPTGDSIYFTKYNPNSCEESTPIRYMF